MPTVSILLPFKNAAPWIAETIQSIQFQTFNDWELIAINDFTEDNTAAIIEEFAQKDPRIVIHKNVNQGIIPALQLALSIAKGKFITRIDADDLMPKNRLANMVNKIENSPAKTVVTGKVQYFSNQEVSKGYLAYQKWLNERIDLSDHYLHIYRECVVASPNWITRKSEMVDHKIFEQLKYPEDYDMVFQWFNNGFKICPIPEVTLLWREHPLRTSRNSNIYDQTSFFNLKTNWFINFYGKNSIGILGVNQKGKLVAKQLITEGIPFEWFDLKYKQLKAKIYNQPIRNPDNIKCETLIIAIYPDKRSDLEKWLIEKGYVIGTNAFWF